MCTVHHYAEFCYALQKWLNKISDFDVKQQMVEEYPFCLKYVYTKLRELTRTQSVDGVSFFKAAMEYYSRVKRVFLWQYGKGKVHQSKHRPTIPIRLHQSYM